MRRLLRPARAAASVAFAGAVAVSLADVAYADGVFSFRRQPAPPPPPPPPAAPPGPNAAPADDSFGFSGGFDAAELQRGADALRKINASPYAKLLFQLMGKQEESRIAEMEAERAQYEVYQKHQDIERNRKFGEDYRENLKQQLQVEAQRLRYEDELARKRKQEEREVLRRQDAELVKMQQIAAEKRERARRETEQKILAEQLQAEREKAEIVRKTIHANAMSDAEAVALEKKLTEEYEKKMLLEYMNGEKEKWLAAINTTFSHIEGGLRTLLTDRSKLVMGVAGVTALAAGVYTTREGARVTWGYVNRILGQPSLIRESSMRKFPLPGLKALKSSSASLSEGAGFENVILHPALKRRIEHLARATANTKSHDAPFRNMLFYGHPGTGKTLVAKEMARKSGLDYAMMTGGDVVPLGSVAVTKIHEIFDWSKKSRKGMLLFIDEADAFLCERNSTQMSEAQRSALNALLFRTGDQSRDIVLVLATNRPGDLDAAITDRMDEVIEFPLPGEEERFKLLKLYLKTYMFKEDAKRSSWRSLLKKQPQKIQVKDITDDLLRDAAQKIDGFSGREITKLMASVQAAVYGSPDCILNPQLFNEVVGYKVAEHHQRMKLASEAAT
ncbi:ATPase family AAA domain-containing protein 3-like [Lolium rigidum]|uniref:ATPase family AAA domain-containing protein 3-like n=1 Tax=Lolium rigidum TaxID=89674 RepID=UPI001F5C3398|nr:ATPase family AAA domain-containing protein 3-like [Lolium rigidum]